MPSAYAKFGEIQCGYNAAAVASATPQLNFAKVVASLKAVDANLAFFDCGVDAAQGIGNSKPRRR